MGAAAGVRWLPALALVFNALTWGVSWWPFRELQSRGLHPLWATALIYALAVVLIAARRPGSLLEVARTPALWVLVLASGTTNASFNWAVTLGDVVRVVLLFYLMPLWAVLLARLLLHERLTAAAALRVAMALAGAAVVLWPEGGGLPLPRTLAEALAVVGGFSFALNNVMLRREAERDAASRALAMFTGGALVSAAMALASGHELVVGEIASWLPGGLALAVAFIGSNLALQYGAARLPANVTAVVMVSEVLFAAVSAVLLGASVPTLALGVGGLLIVGASLLAAGE